MNATTALLLVLLTGPAALLAQDRPAPAPAPEPTDAAKPDDPARPDDSAPADDTAAPDDAPSRPATPGALPPVEPPPALSAMEAEKLKRAIKKLRNDSDKHRHAAEKEVIAFGRGAIPLLEDAATTDHASMMDALVNCLCGVADAHDRDRVEADMTSSLVVLRRFAARESGNIGTPELLDKLLPMLADADRPTQVEAALSLVRNGREEGLAVLTLAYGGSYGPGWNERVLAALPGIADKGSHDEVGKLLTIDPEREKSEPDVASNERLAAVRLLHAIGDRAATALIVRALDDRHNVVQREAINALRDLLEQKGPLEASSIFQQLTEVKRLKDVAASKV